MGRGQVTFGFGKYRSGNRGQGTSDTPHRVILTHPFCMDATEVTVGAYRACVDQQGCAVPRIADEWSTYRKDPRMPINDVDWKSARYYCEKQGKSLPTEAQWEWAAGGGDGRKYPWGDEPPDCKRADFSPGPTTGPVGDFGCHGGGPSLVGTHPAGDRVLPDGALHDLAGNVWEWVLDEYHPLPPTTATDPLERRPSGMHVVRGGGWNRSAASLQVSFRGGAIEPYRVPGLGFRCVRNLPPG